MGYTHYFNMAETTKEDKEGWNKALPIIQDIINNHRHLIQYEMDDDSAPVADSDAIRFNGIGEDGHETFLVPFAQHDSFCKTARKPYDLPVCKVLLILNAYIPSFSIGSDGFSAHMDNPVLDCFWMEAIEGVSQYRVYYKPEVINERSPYCDLIPSLSHALDWKGE